ncbi:cation:dicarboxylate symporter family transporter [Janthinobacterium sp. SUN211]|uniref:cation:dicarboxylate symporter family transporter n=1 Tax=Janthinobacterium sp. SUN211 TaxID=3014786 RepID=UPI00350F3470
MVPVGYTFNLDGAAIFLGVATIFIVQLYGIDPSVTYPDGLAKYTAAFLNILTVAATHSQNSPPSILIICRHHWHSQWQVRYECSDREQNSMCPWSVASGTGMGKKWQCPQWGSIRSIVLLPSR